MKWYWAILLTLLILTALVGAGSVNESGGKALAGLISGISAVWVAADSSSFGWGLFVMFLWPIGLPSCLIGTYEPRGTRIADTVPHH